MRVKIEKLERLKTSTGGKVGFQKTAKKIGFRDLRTKEH
jgi:hypothetical protein